MGYFSNPLAEGRVSNEEGRHLGMKHDCQRLKTSGKSGGLVNVKWSGPGPASSYWKYRWEGPHPDDATWPRAIHHQGLSGHWDTKGWSPELKVACLLVPFRPQSSPGARVELADETTTLSPSPAWLCPALSLHQLSLVPALSKNPHFKLNLR